MHHLPIRANRSTSHAVGAALAAVFCTFILAAPTRAAEPNSDGDPWFRIHVFTGSGGCLAVQDGQSLARGDTVQVFEKGKQVSIRRIDYLISSARAEQVYKERRFDGVYKDSALRDSFGCYWGIRPEPPRWIARCDGGPNQDIGLPIAIKDLPKGALTIGGDERPLAPQDVERIAQQISASIPDDFRKDGVLRAGRRYSSDPAHEITEILLGRPFGPATPFDSIQICVLFTYNGRVLAVDRLSRVTGVEERVDTEAPTLDGKNWFEIQDETMGFFSVNAGATWKRISIDIGFEGYLWSICSLTVNLPEVWSHYLYTAH